MSNKYNYISFSGGVESTTMCILYGADAKAIWCDTGSEHEAMYQRMDFVEAEIKKLHPYFEIIRIKPSVKAAGKQVSTLEQAAIEWKFMPSQQMRYCTSKFKIQPIDNFFKNKTKYQNDEYTLMIGFNFDEQGRTGNLELLKDVKYKYPLIDDGYTRQDCEEILTSYNLHPKFPVYMTRGGCRMCFFKSQKEYKAMWFLNNKEYLEVQQFEEQIQDRRKKFYSIMGNGKSLRQLAIECEAEKKFMVNADWEDLYKSLKKETSCGAFCHR
jgi:3'-phosphoadenosine 5'-phosphosulfate sulfotransferase (PAPS reductase)/FAD synthetase